MKFKKLTEEEMNDIQKEREIESKKVQEWIEYLKNNRANNADGRAEFAKTIFQLALSSDKEARKFIKKISMFCQFYGDDYQISQDEWQKLNNSEGLVENKNLEENFTNKLTEYVFSRD